MGACLYLNLMAGESCDGAGFYNMTNPFDWKNQPAKISMRDVDSANKQAYQQTAVINRRRAQGIEPSIIYSLKKHDAQPKKFVTEMPDMEVHPSTLRARRRKLKEK